MRRFWKKLKRLLFVLWLANLIYTISLRWLQPPITPNMIVSIARNINTDYGFRHKNLSYSEMGTPIKWAVIASEDQKFATHHGIDFAQLKNALGDKSGRQRGASTLTQQTAKNLFYLNKRSWIRKALEAYSTVLLEIFIPKQKILEHYLNIAEMGPNIYGISAAADYYFKKSPRQLSSSEANFIASILPSPVKRGQQRQLSSSKTRWIARQIPYLKKSPENQSLVNGN